MQQWQALKTQEICTLFSNAKGFIFLNRPPNLKKIGRNISNFVSLSPSLKLNNLIFWTQLQTSDYGD